VFHNPVKDTDGPNQTWASDITYVRTDEGFLYLCLITDMRSRKTAGYHAGDTPGAEGAGYGAGATAGRGASRPPFGPGLSVLSAFVCRKTSGAGAGGKHDMRRRTVMKTPLPNGILKQEYALGCAFRSKKQALAAIDQAVFLYNTARPHMALNYETPEKMHRKVA
jgi:hypothetical protein